MPASDHILKALVHFVRQLLHSGRVRGPRGVVPLLGRVDDQAVLLAHYYASRLELSNLRIDVAQSVLTLLYRMLEAATRRLHRAVLRKLLGRRFHHAWA